MGKLQLASCADSKFLMDEDTSENMTATPGEERRLNADVFGLLHGVRTNRIAV